MSKRAIWLGGQHWHRLLCIPPAKNGMSVHKKAELAICKLLREPIKLNIVKTIGHLDAVYTIFRYLQRYMNKNKGQLGFDPVIPIIDPMLFQNSSQNVEHWKEFYPDAHEPIPLNMPEPLGNPVDTSANVDPYHAGNLVNGRLHSGILIYVNNSLITSHIPYIVRKNKYVHAKYVINIYVDCTCHIFWKKLACTYLF
jgi:hypothetical protein